MTSKGEMLRVAFKGRWYDLSSWSNVHPGGAHIIKQFEGRDCTEHFYSLHSEKAARMFERFKPLPEDKKDPAPQPHPLDQAFGQFREDVMNTFRPSKLWDSIRFTVPVLMAILGVWLAPTHPIMAAFVLGLMQQQSGWFGHEFAHRKSGFSPETTHTMLQLQSGVLCGYSAPWWIVKHSVHHLCTNVIGADPDIHNQPILFLWAPSKALDTHFRKYQHLYCWPLYSLLSLSWRLQSLQLAIRERDFASLFYIAMGYSWLLLVNPWVVLGSCLLAGFFIAIVVTLEHETEEMMETPEESFVISQLRATRDVECPDPFTEYFFGDMQYQLVHHLLPGLPSCHLRAVMPLLKQFMQEQGLEYKSVSLWDAIKSHYQTIKENALVEARDGYDKGCEVTAFTSLASMDLAQKQ